ncbi:MAG: hypothetical protein ACE14S_06760 [Candidatus Bathyarchaeia archaeon]
MSQDTLPVGAPLFTSDDINIPGLALDLNTSIADFDPPVYISPFDWELLRAIYTRISKEHACIILRIYYFDTVEDAKNNFDETWEHEKGNSELYQTDPENYPTIIESEFSTNYGSLITSRNLGSAENPEYLREGNRAIYGADLSPSDPHVAIIINADGEAFTSDSEIKEQMDIVTQHARNLILNTPRKTATPSNATPSKVPSQLPTQTQEPAEEMEIMWFEGTVEVCRAGSNSWIPAATGMVLHDGDQIRTMGENSENRALLHYAGSAQSYYRGTDIHVQGYSQLTVENYSQTHGGPGFIQFVRLMGALQDGSLFCESTRNSKFEPGDIGLFALITASAIIKHRGTQFEVTVTNYGTYVNTFEGSVEVSDINGTNSVLVGTNQTTTVPNGGVPLAPLAFNPSAMDQWWTNFPESSTLNVSDSGIFNYLIIAVVAIVIVAVAVGVFAVSRRKKTHLPPPPPP